MVTNMAKTEVTPSTAKKAITDWKETRGNFQAYADAMSVIGNSCNFLTSAQPPSMMDVHLPNLDFTLRIPASIEL